MGQIQKAHGGERAILGLLVATIMGRQDDHPQHDDPVT